jgi:hypothetical protein
MRISLLERGPSFTGASVLKGLRMVVFSTNCFGYFQPAAPAGATDGMVV